MGYRVGVDSGGTFTDLQAVDDHGTVHILKVPSTPADPSLGFRTALAALLERAGGDPASIDIIVHGTTVAVNAILQGRFPAIGLVVTRGFRHVLELARQTVPGERGAIYTWVKPPRLVPLRNVREVTERISARGDVMTAFDEQECREVARWYRDQGIDTVAICFVNSYANGEHERRARDCFRSEHPDCFVSISSETLPEFREYERAVTTSMNALLMPILGRYVERVRGHLADLGVRAPLFIMKSGGGASRADLAIETPVYTAFSGPAAAVAGLAWLGQAAGYENLITFDMGGTSTDVSLVEHGRPTLVTEAEVDVYPVRAPTIDVVSVGAGGGSIAWLAPGERIRVGPRSAGADPGPACYGRGGQDATITDANLYLGRLPAVLAGGAVTLEPVLAARAIATFAERVGLAPDDAARGIVEICELNMADAIRQVSVQKGRDPRLFVLVAAGGAGPLHACRLAELLHIPTVLIPPSPGVGCSLGALVSNVREDFVMTDIQRQSQLDRERLARNLRTLEARAETILERQGFGPGARRIERSADLRYRGMRTELTVPIPDGPVDDPLIDALVQGLHDAHRAAYGYAYEGQQEIEIVNLRATGVGLLPPIEPPHAPAPGGRTAPRGTRPVFFAAHGWIDTPVYDRQALGAGATLAGPAIVEQYDTTSVILPGQMAVVDRFGNLIVTTAAGQARAATPAAIPVEAAR